MVVGRAHGNGDPEGCGRIYHGPEMGQQMQRPGGRTGPGLFLETGASAGGSVALSVPSLHEVGRH